MMNKFYSSGKHWWRTIIIVVKITVFLDFVHPVVRSYVQAIFHYKLLSHFSDHYHAHLNNDITIVAKRN
jgi:hypothetical protein